MELGKEEFGFVCGHTEPCERLNQKLKEYDNAKMRAAEQREQVLLEKNFLIEKIINKIKYRFKTR